jgi:hypothetical protein
VSDAISREQAVSAASEVAVGAPDERILDPRRPRDDHHTAPLLKTGSRVARAVRAAGPLVVLVPLVQALAILWLIWERSTDVPMHDEWSMVGLVQCADQGSLRAGDFWALNTGGHRVVIPRLTTLALIELTDWHRQVIMTVNLVLVVMTGVLLLQAVRSTVRSPVVTVLLVVLVSLFLFSFTRYHNWLKPYTDKVTTGLGVAVCVWALVAWPVGRRRFSLAVVGALVASLSSVGGLAAWIAFLPAVWGTDRRRVAIWVAIALAVIGAYSVGYPFGEATGAEPGDILTIPGYVVGFLGAPIGVKQLGLAQATGLISLVLVVAGLLANQLFGVSSRPGRQSLAAWTGLALFGLGVATMGALGREGHNEGLASRYTGFSVLWWIGVVVITVVVATRLVDRLRAHEDGTPRTLLRILVGVNLVALGLVVVGAVAASTEGFRLGMNWQAEQRQHQRCVLANESAPDECLLLFGNRHLVRGGLPYLAQRRLAIFRHGDGPDESPPAPLPSSKPKKKRRQVDGTPDQRPSADARDVSTAGSALHSMGLAPLAMTSPAKRSRTGSTARDPAAADSVGRFRHGSSRRKS